MSILCHYRRNVRVVMLYRDHCCISSVLLRPACRQITGMPIVSDQCRCHAKNVTKMVHRRLKCNQRLPIFHVTDMLTHERIVLVCDTKRRLQFTADGQHWRHSPWQLNGEMARIRANGELATTLFQTSSQQNRRNACVSADRASTTHPPALPAVYAPHRYP